MGAYIFLRYEMKNALKVERAKHNITQADLAEKVRVSRQTINSIEIGKYVPSTLLALKIAAVFNTGVNDIFTLEDQDWN
jgi:putative transcriptional regulator